MNDYRMAEVRRIVTGQDSAGRSRIEWDGPAPSRHDFATGAMRGYCDLWVWQATPPSLSGDSDAGKLGYEFPGPALGGHLRVVQSRGRSSYGESVADGYEVPSHPATESPSGRSWDRGGSNSYSGSMHKTQTIDYAILLKGERVLELDDGEVIWSPGDVLIDVGAWHRWKSPSVDGVVVYDMIAAQFLDGTLGCAQQIGQREVRRSPRDLPLGFKPTRRIVVADRPEKGSAIISDGPCVDVQFDDARPGFSMSCLWVVDSAPARLALETSYLSDGLLPPANGSICRTVTLPPDDLWKGKVGTAEVANFFRKVHAPQASTLFRDSPHPYMQRTQTLDFCCVVSGEAVLVLDLEEVTVHAGDVVVLRGSNHAWSNRTNTTATLAIASHDATP